MRPDPETLAALRADLEGVAMNDDPKYVAAKSKDYFWYSPILSAELDGMTGDLVVQPATEAEVARVAAACARRRVPLTVRGGGTGNYGQCVPMEGGRDPRRHPARQGAGDRARIGARPGRDAHPGAGRSRRRDRPDAEHVALDPAARHHRRLRLRRLGRDRLAAPRDAPRWRQRARAAGDDRRGGAAGDRTPRRGHPAGPPRLRDQRRHPRPHAGAQPADRVGPHGRPLRRLRRSSALRDRRAGERPRRLPAHPGRAPVLALLPPHGRILPPGPGRRVRDDRRGRTRPLRGARRRTRRSRQPVDDGRRDRGREPVARLRMRVEPHHAAGPEAGPRLDLPAGRLSPPVRPGPGAAPDGPLRRRGADAPRDGADGRHGADLRAAAGALDRQGPDVPDHRRDGGRRLRDLRSARDHHRGRRHEGDRRRPDRVQASGRPPRPDESGENRGWTAEMAET